MSNRYEAGGDLQDVQLRPEVIPSCSCGYLDIICGECGDKRTPEVETIISDLRQRVIDLEAQAARMPLQWKAEWESAQRQVDRQADHILEYRAQIRGARMFIDKVLATLGTGVEGTVVTDILKEVRGHLVIGLDPEKPAVGA